MIEPQPLSLIVKQFIAAHEHAEVASIVLKHKEVDGLPIALVAEQLSGRRKARYKLPHYYAHDGILYPPSLNLEQTSSELTATYKAELLRSIVSGDALADLTGGFGIDALAFAHVFKNVVHVEPDHALQRLAQFNHQLLGVHHVLYDPSRAEDFLEAAADKRARFAAIYIDPSRRKSTRKVFSFSDCTPDVTALQRQISKLTDVLMVKASPMLDLQLALQQLTYVQRVVVLAVDNEVKELLFVTKNGFETETTYSAINISHSGTVAFDFLYSEEMAALPSFSHALRFLYEPNAALMKAGAFRLVATRYGLSKLHANTHLYTSDVNCENFPGRVFKVLAPVKPDRGSIMEFFPDTKANIIIRNYTTTPDELKRRLRLSDGGERYLIGFTSHKGPSLVVAERLK